MKLKRISILAVCLLLANILLLAGCGKKEELDLTDEVEKFQSELEEGKFSEAADLYDELSPSDMTLANKVLKNGVTEIKEKYFDGSYDYSTASVLLDGYSSFSSVRSDAASALDEIKKDNSMNTALEQGKSYFSSGNYESAINSLKTVAVTSRYYAESSELLSKAIEEYRKKVIEDCDKLAAEKNLTQLLTLLNKASSVLPDDTDLAIKKSQYMETFETIALQEGAEKAAAGEYYEAYQCMEKWGKQIDSEEIKNKATEYLEQASDQEQDRILAEAQALADQKEWQKAITYLEKSLGSWYETDKIEAQIEVYKGRLPKKLQELNLIDKNRYYIEENYTDQFGNFYETVVSSHNYDGFALYYVNNQYNTFEAYCFASENNGTIKIYCDDVLAEVYSGISRNTEPYLITVDITGCKQLKIEFSYPGYPCLGNPVVSNQ